jgi:predicted MarR family transcription regulator
MTGDTPELRDEDQLVLNQVEQGNDDVQKITEATILENHQVTYAFQKLEDLQLLTVSRPDQMVERTINGQKRVFQHPKTAKLTEQGEQVLSRRDEKELEKYQDLTQKELVEKVHSLETRINELENKLRIFRKQVQ